VTDSEEFDFNALVKTITAKLGLNDEVSLKLLRVFTESLAEEVEALKEAILKADEKRILDIAHKLKGSAGTVSLDEIASLMKDLEVNIANYDGKSYNKFIERVEYYLQKLKERM
jgi:HPt (histidine-containing phosphotransfer) domain-containing protein